MELAVLEETKTKMVVELKGEDHTFCNLLKNELWNDDKVHVSTYVMNHPSIGVPRIHLETASGRAPRDALLDAAKRMGKNVEAFKKAAEKELK